MLTETLSGQCPCCGYDKMIQRYGSDGYYHLDGCLKPLSIDENKFKESGMKANYPNDFEVLKKYIK